MVRRVSRIAALALIASMALSGCVRILADTAVHADNTYSQHIIVAVNEAAVREFIGPGGGDISEMFGQATDADAFQDLVDQYPESATVGPYTDGNLDGIEVKVDSLPLAQFNDAATSVTGAVGAVATLERVGDTFVVTLSSDSVQELSGLDSAGGDLALLDNAIDVAVIYSFPGLVTEASAGTIRGKAVQLSLSDLLNNQEIRIVAGAEPAIDWAPIVRWSLITLAFVAIVGGATLLVMQDRRRQRRTNLPPPRPSTTP